MSSGSLPIATYHRAESLGSGTYGSVITVYNDDGEEFALKLFLPDDDDDEPAAMDISAMREISVLRLLRDKNKHDNVVELVDVKEAHPNDDDEQCGAGIPSDCLGVVLPLYRKGTLSDAINKQQLTGRKDKVMVAHGLLSAVAYLHDNGIIHRDIKCDNVLMAHDNDEWKPVLIDFSLAKVVTGTMFHEGFCDWKEQGATHTGEIGTVTYTAPEVVNRESYGLESDLWSVGVVLLEMIQQKTLEVEKNKDAFRLIDEAKETMPDQPLPNLVRGLLEKDPAKRLSAREALQSPLFYKFGLEVPPVKIIDIDAALPLTAEEDDLENSLPNSTNKSGNDKKLTARLQKREKVVRRLCGELSCKHPTTPRAALCYAEKLYKELDDTIDDLSNSQGLLDCVVLATRFFEVALLNLHDLETRRSFANWSMDDYFDMEATLWMLMDYCLIPRSF